jgi:hypothetical protein
MWDYCHQQYDNITFCDLPFKDVAIASIMAAADHFLQ